MIGRLSGKLAEKSPPMVLVDVQGVGYEVDVPMSTFYNLPAVGEPVVLLTHFVVREDAQVLFGFGTPAERATFRELVKINGVGPHQRGGPAHCVVHPEWAERGRAHRRGGAAGRCAPGQGAWHRQEDRRAVAAGTEGQARPGTRRPHRRWMTRRPTSPRPCRLWATTNAKPRPRSRRCRRALASAKASGWRSRR